MLRPLGMCEGLRAPVDADDEDADVDEDALLPPFTLLALAAQPLTTALGTESSRVLAMGEAPGWRLAPELRVGDLSLDRPLLDSAENTNLFLRVSVLTALLDHPARLRARPPARFRFPWAAASTASKGVGATCEEPTSDTTATELACHSVLCYVSVTTNGQEVPLPHCSTSDDQLGCCYGPGTSSANVYVQLMPTANATAIPSGAQVEVTFLEVQTSSSFEVGLESASRWTLATEQQRGAAYELLDEALVESPELYEGVARAVVEPTQAILSYDRDTVVVLFELKTPLPSAPALLTLLAPAGFTFRSGPLDLDTQEARSTYIRAWSKAGLPESQVLRGNGEIAASTLPAGVAVTLGGPRLLVEFTTASGGGTALLPFAPFAFAVHVDCPDVRRGREDSYWLLQLSTRTTGGAWRLLQWGRMAGFVLQGSIPQLQIAPSALLPLYPRNVVELAFMLSQHLPRAPPAPPGTFWSVTARASMLVVIPPVGYVFPPQCEARDALGSSTLSGTSLSWARPWNCILQWVAVV
eukprot:s1081_g1.t1